MTESDRSNQDYRVGPGRPPKHTRFKPGQSGNPKGRPKGRVSMQTAAERELMKLVDVPENGKTRRLTKQAMVVRTLVHQSIKGDHKATDMLIRNFAQTKEGGLDRLSQLRNRPLYHSSNRLPAGTFLKVFNY